MKDLNGQMNDELDLIFLEEQNKFYDFSRKPSRKMNRALN
jgi:hypothetical protein